MKWKIFILTLISLIFSACSNIEPESPYLLKTFGAETLTTKAQNQVTWVVGDSIRVYSLDTDKRIIHYDDALVTSIRGSVGKVTAEVAKDAASYYAVYPRDAVKSDLGEILAADEKDDFNFRRTGVFGDVSIMTKALSLKDKTIYFQNRFSLACILDPAYEAKNHILQSIDGIEVNVPKDFSEDAYYIAIDCVDRNVDIVYLKGTTYTTIKKTFYPDHVYQINYRNGMYW